MKAFVNRYNKFDRKTDISNRQSRKSLNKKKSKKRIRKRKLNSLSANMIWLRDRANKEKRH
jgi:hypothetical protein